MLIMRGLVGPLGLTSPPSSEWSELLLAPLSTILAARESTSRGDSGITLVLLDIGQKPETSVMVDCFPTHSLK